MAKLQIVIDGDGSQNAADELTAILADGEKNADISRVQPSALPAGARKIIDPLSLAGVILAIPGTVLAVMDLADRLRKRKKAQALIDAAKRLHEKSHVQTTVITSDGSALALYQLTADALLEIVAKLDQG